MITMAMIIAKVTQPALTPIQTQVIGLVMWNPRIASLFYVT